MPLIKIRGLGNKVHLSDEYAVVNIYFLGYQDKEPGPGKIPHESYLVNELSCKALISNDISDIKGFKIDIQNRQYEIRSVKNLVCPGYRIGNYRNHLDNPKVAP